MENEATKLKLFWSEIHSILTAKAFRSKDHIPDILID